MLRYSRWIFETSRHFAKFSNDVPGKQKHPLFKQDVV